MTDSLGCNILRLRGLPYEATSEDVLKFFDGFQVAHTQILHRNGKPTGEAYVELASPDDAAKAMDERQREHIGDRYIEIFPAGEATLVALATKPTSPTPSLHGEVLRLRGLPFNSNAHDVLEFLNPVVPVGGGAAAVFPCTADARPTGEVFIEVASPAEAEAALAKNNQLLGARYIEVFPASKGELYLTAHQRGFFVFIDGCRVHHAPLPLGATADAAAAAAEAARKALLVGGGAGTEARRGAAGGALRPEDLADAVGGMSLSQHRDGRGGGQSSYPSSSTYGLPVGGVGGGGSPWVSLPLPSPGPRPAGFNPAPGPAGSRQGGAGARQGARGGGGSGGGGPPPGFDGYGTGSVVMTPFMLQHPFMGPQTTTWGAPAGFLAAQQQAAAAGAAWYAGNQRAMQQAYTSVGYGTTPGYYYGQQAAAQVQQAPYYPPRGGGQHPRGRGRAASPHSSRQHRSSSTGSGGGRGMPRPADTQGQQQGQQLPGADEAPGGSNGAAAESS